MKTKRLVFIFPVLLLVFSLAIGLAMMARDNGNASRSGLVGAEHNVYAGPMDALVITAQELPANWTFDMAGTADLHGVEVKKYYFYNTTARDLRWVNIGQTIAIYPDEDQAKSAYPDWVNEIFVSNAWQPATDLEVSGHADEQLARCIPATVNGISTLSCGQLTRYKNIVIRVLGNTFEKQWLTKNDFRTVLIAIDTRITDALSPVQ